MGWGLWAGARGLGLAMNLILFNQQDRIDPERIHLKDQRCVHLREVLGASTGDTLRVGEINGKMGHATLIQIDEHGAVLEIDLDQSPPPKLPLSLVLALPRPKMLRRILRTVAELGVAELHLINSYRVEKSYWQTPALERGSVERYFLQGLSQAKDTVLPKLKLRQRFKPFVEDELPALLNGKTALLAHPGQSPLLQACQGDTVIVIGPEGGFIPYELEKLKAAGCQMVSLGSRIVRVETAVIHSISRFQQP